MSKTINPSMMLITASWQGFPAFKMIPVTAECPYTECLFDPTSKVFVVITKTTKTSLHMLTKLDDNGDPQTMKAAPRSNGKNVKESRVSLTTFQEHYIDNMDDAKAIIAMFAVNSDTFKYQAILDKEKQQMDTPSSLLL
jgi:hypothetical protein